MTAWVAASYRSQPRQFWTADRRSARLGREGTHSCAPGAGEPWPRDDAGLFSPMSWSRPPVGWGAATRAGWAQWFRSAEMSWDLLIFERPSMPMSRARFISCSLVMSS